MGSSKIKEKAITEAIVEVLFVASKSPGRRLTDVESHA